MASTTGIGSWGDPSSEIAVAPTSGTGDPRLARAVAHVASEAHRVGVKELTVTANRTGPGWQDL